MATIGIRGNRAYIAVGKQSVGGTAVAPTIFPRFLDGSELQIELKAEDIWEMDTSRRLSQIIKNRQLVKIKQIVVPRPVEVGFLECAAQGSGSDAVTAPASNTTLTAAGPTAAPATTTNASGGTVAAGTYSVEVTYVTATGETLPSPNGPITTSGSTSTITVPSPVSVPGATGWYAYVSQANGSTLTRQQTVGSPTAIGTNLTLTAPPTNTGANPPTAGTSGTVAGATTFQVASNAGLTAAGTAVLDLEPGLSTEEVVTVTTPVTPQVATPGTAPSLSTATTGGTIAAGTYTIGYTWITPTGETPLSPTAAQVTTGSTSTITITVPTLPGGATGWNLYIAAVGTSTPLFKQGGSPFSAVTTTITAPPTTSGSQPPTSNTAGPFFTTIASAGVTKFAHANGGVVLSPTTHTETDQADGNFYSVEVSLGDTAGIIIRVRDCKIETCKRSAKAGTLLVYEIEWVGIACLVQASPTTVTLEQRAPFYFTQGVWTLDGLLTGDALNVAMFDLTTKNNLDQEIQTEQLILGGLIFGNVNDDVSIEVIYTVNTHIGLTYFGGAAGTTDSQTIGVGALILVFTQPDNFHILTYTLTTLMYTKAEPPKPSSKGKAFRIQPLQASSTSNTGQNTYVLQTKIQNTQTTAYG